MKKAIIIPIILLSLFFVLLKAVLAAQATISLNPVNQSVNSGNTFAVTLRASDVADMDNLMADILFDSSKVSYDHAVVSNDIASLNWNVAVFDCLDPSPGCKNILAMSDLAHLLNGSADIVTLYFVANAAGTNSFTYANNHIYGASFNEIIPAWNPASVVIAGAASPAKTITAFNFAGWVPAIVGNIDESAHAITATVPYGTDVTALAPTVTITGASVSPASGAAQNFTSPITYTVTAADGSTQTYTVTVTIAPDTTAPQVTSFTMPATADYLVVNINTFSATDAAGVTGYLLTESAAAPLANDAGWTDTAPFFYTFATAGSKTLYAWVKDAAGNISNSLNGSVVITLPSSAKDIILFNFTGLTPAVVGMIDGTNHAIALIVPDATNLNALAPTITITGASVSPASGAAQNFTNPATYTVTAADGSIQTYLVTVIREGGIGGGGGGIGGGGDDMENPSITINLPTIQPTYATSSASLAIGGVASDNAEISSVAWSNNLGGSGAVSGATSWNANISLMSGQNIITVTARDAAGNTATDAITIIFDNTAPIITAVSAGDITTTGATISWTTDEPADAQVEYGLAASYGSLSALNTATTTAHTVALSGLSQSATYHYRVISKDILGNMATSTDYTFATLTPAPAPVAAPSGGGGVISGGAILPPWPTSYPEPTLILPPTYAPIPPTTISQVLGEKIRSAEASVNAAEADIIYNYNKFVDLNEATKELYIFVRSHGPQDLTDQEKYAVAYYIHNGTLSTEKMGAGERTSVLYSYLTAFNKLPRSASEWLDVIRIANGHWPAERQSEAKTVAEQNWFARVYNREADMNNANDQAAVTIVAYGLRPKPRNLESEELAIQIFETIFGQLPSSAVEWDIMRAIAYSGAKR